MKTKEILNEWRNFNKEETMKITESKLREIIRNVIKEGEFGDLGMTPDVSQDARSLIGKLRSEFPEVNFVDYTHFDGHDRDPQFAEVQEEHAIIRNFINSRFGKDVTFEDLVMAEIDNGMIPGDLKILDSKAAKLPGVGSIVYGYLELSPSDTILVVRSQGMGYTNYYFCC